MPKFKAKVAHYFTVTVDSENIDTAKGVITLSSSEELLKHKDDSVIEYTGIEEIEEIS